MSGIFLSTRLISFVSKNHRFANPIKQPIISSASPVKMSGIFRSTRLISFVSKNHRLTNPIKPAYPVNPPPPHFSTTPPRRPKRSTSPPTRTKDRYASSVIHMNPIQKHSIDFDEKDMASEESLWDLYGRWISHQKVSRTLEDKQNRFVNFKRVVRDIHEANQLGTSCVFGLNEFSDWHTSELYPPVEGFVIPPQPKFNRSSKENAGGRRDVGSSSHAMSSQRPSLGGCRGP